MLNKGLLPAHLLNKIGTYLSLEASRSLDLAYMTSSFDKLRDLGHSLYCDADIYKYLKNFIEFFTEIEKLDKEDKGEASIFFSHAGDSLDIFKEIYDEWKRICFMNNQAELTALNIPLIDTDTSSEIYSGRFGSLFKAVHKIKISNEEFERLESYIEDNKICTEKDLQKILEKKDQEIFFITRKGEFYRLIKDILELQSVGFIVKHNNKKLRVELFHSNGEVIHRLLAQQNKKIGFSQIRNVQALFKMCQGESKQRDISSLIITKANPEIRNKFFNYIKNQNQCILSSEKISDTSLQTETLYIYLSKEILTSKNSEDLIDLIIEHIKNVINSRESKRNRPPSEGHYIIRDCVDDNNREVILFIPVCINIFMKIVIVAEDLSNSEIIMDMDSEFIINDCLAGSNTTNNEIVFDVNLVEKINPKESFIETRKALEKICMDLLNYRDNLINK
jgi:hypothetical protein